MKAKSKKKLLALFLSSMMLTSAFAFASCKDDDTTTDDDTETEDTTEVEDDELLVTNGGFETFNDNDGLNLIGTSVNGWTRATNTATSGSALSSKSASGIIDTESEAWDNLTVSKLGELKASELTEAQAQEKWDSMSAKDKLEYYKAWKDNDDNDDSEISDLEFYESFNIDDEDLPTCANPKTHDNSTENTKVLMIHNNYYNSSYETIGTAQKFTSSSTVTVQAGTSAKLSVWVKTSDLQSTTSGGESQEAVDKGAYIRVTNNLGGTTQDPIEIKNINTKDVTENNGWVQYTLLLKGASFTDTTFTLVLGLGQSGGTDRYEYVNGYAFFDDIQVETLTNSEYTKLVDADEDNLLDDGVTQITLDTKKNDRVVEAKNVADVKYFALDYYESAEPSNINGKIFAETWSFEATTEENGNKTYVSTTNLKPENTIIAPTLGTGLSNANDKIAIYANAEAMNDANNKYLQTVYNDYLKDTDDDNDFLKNQSDKNILMLLSASGASYTAKLNYDFTFDKDEYKAISFYVKTSDMTNFTGGGVKVVNKNDSSNSVSISAITTATLEGVKVGDVEDYYDGWQKCYIFVSNETDDTQTVNLSFSFGPTTIYDSTETSYQPGFMAVTGFETYAMDEKIFALAKSGSYAQILSLTDADDDDNTSTGFDSALGVSDRTLEDGYANLQNYMGVTSDSDYVSANGTGTEESLKINTLATAGLLSKENITKLDDNDVEIENDKYTEILTALGGVGAKNEEMWASVFGGDNVLGESKQPLVIYNPDEAVSYGFIGTSTAVSDYTPISVRVKVGGHQDAKAFVYLIDMDDDSYQKTLSVGRNQTYWYDDDGNICASDPTKSGFSSKRDVAFKLQTNGLYKVNPNWTGATGIDANAYYANLSVYEKDKDNGNLLVAKGGVSYNYTSNWLNDGNDGVAFYYNKDANKYYADSAKTVEVNDLASIANLARYEQKEKQSAMFEISNTNGEWATVTFYIHAGESTKNYRLEVWSGSRDGATKNPAGSIVIYDTITADALTADTWKTNIDERKEDLTDGVDYFESVFSFYDSNKFLRYDETADENEVGNSYESYVSSSYTSDIAYLRYAKDNVYEMYMNYSLSDVTVSADVEEEETEEEETEEETTESETNVWLLVSSIAIASVLLLAVVSIIVRNIIKKVRKNRGRKVSKK